MFPSKEQVIAGLADYQKGSESASILPACEIIDPFATDDGQIIVAERHLGQF